MRNTDEDNMLCVKDFCCIYFEFISIFFFIVAGKLALILAVVLKTTALP